MSFNGVRLFRYNLLFEAATSAIGGASMILNPSSSLALFLPATTPATAALKAQTQWIGAVILAFTAPLLLCYPNIPREAAARRMTYTTFLAVETCVGLVAAAQFALGGSGMKDGALLAMAGMMAFFAGMRVFFLFVKPGWIEAQENVKKVKKNK